MQNQLLGKTIDAEPCAPILMLCANGPDGPAGRAREETMCLAVPMRLIEVDGNKAKAEVGGVIREIRLDLLEGVGLDDYVIVHAGYAIETLDEEEAMKTIEMLEQII